MANLSTEQLTEYCRRVGAVMEPLAVTVSGGRSSGYVAWFLHTYLSEAYDLTFIFTNTGQEHPETLEFVNNITKHMGIPIVWLESVTHHNTRKSSGYKIVSYETASRGGEPFKEMIKKYGIPNQSYGHCTRELKINPMSKYMAERGIRLKTLGIRADEMKRYKPTELTIYPMIEWMHVVKEDVYDFWSKQSFDLLLPEHLGNCLTCYKKSDRKLKTIARNYPEYFVFNKEMEDLYGHLTTNGSQRKWFRGNLSTDEVLKMSRGEFDEFQDPHWGEDEIESCAEECGTVDPEYLYDPRGIV